MALSIACEEDFGISSSVSVCESSRDVKRSMLYSVLPAVLQDRIPALPSIRRSIVDLRARSTQGKNAFAISPISSPETPPPEYTSRPGTSNEIPEGEMADSFGTEELDYGEETEDERPLSSSSSIGTLPPPFPLSEAETGINWRYANQGISLLTQAFQESNAVARDVDDSSAVLARQLYLHGMSYLIRGIPTDLTREETLSLQAAIPANMLNLHNDPENHAMVSLHSNTAVSQDCPQGTPSILHRLTATMVFQTFVVVQFLLPYVKLFIGHAYRWEQEHRLTRKIFNKSIMTADELGRRTIQLSQTVCQMNDGKVGQAVNDVTLWWVRGLTGGIQQGVSEGVVIMGNERRQSSKRGIEKSG